ncbi:hypothetical protein Rhe02_53020 [Rhizocola hellebori]|uniref:SCO6045-like C-terminal domain-containing protein n=1 Tax=Rhizocola hellebori TaxID=1392758 RepID=A0A8J3QCP0_9ACTN|nr:hypothetical protein [Rhizocola hellebori]GIH07235.1 hypothetical protein Rhe02_53020 [Rhizocola hellebori]
MNLAERQAALVAALVAGADAPEGFDTRHLAAARAALLAKRAEEVRQVWPALCAAYGPQWAGVFARWADSRPPQGALRDGWDFALDHPPTAGGMVELRIRQATWVRPRSGPLRRRRLPMIRWCASETSRHRIALQLAGRIYLLP